MPSMPRLFTRMSLRSNSNNPSSASTSQRPEDRSQQDNRTCMLDGDCQDQLGRSSLIQIPVSNQERRGSNLADVHRNCLKELICGQLVDGVSPTAMRTPNGQNISWRDVVVATSSEDGPFEYESDDNSFAMRSMALTILAQNTVLRNMRQSHPEDFARFAFDVGRSIHNTDSIVVDQTTGVRNQAQISINKSKLLEMAIEVALMQEQFSDLPRMCKKLNQCSVQENYNLSGIIVPREAIAEWAAGRNLPLNRTQLREIRNQCSNQHADAIEGYMRTDGEDQEIRNDNVMLPPVVQDTVDRFETIVDAYPSQSIDHSQAIEIAVGIIINWRNSPECQYDNTDNRLVTNGLRRLQTDNHNVQSFGGRSQAQVLARLCSYINSPSHSTEKRNNIIAALASALKDIGCHIIESPHGQVGVLMSVPQGLDERDPGSQAMHQVSQGQLVSMYQNRMSSMIAAEKPFIESLERDADTEVLNEVLRSILKATAYHHDVLWSPAYVSYDVFHNAFDQVLPPGFDISNCI